MAKDTETRKQILLCAARLFGERSFMRVSIRDIADQVGVTPASLYYYFESKEDILDELIKKYIRVHERFSQETIRRVKEPGYQPHLRDILYTYAEEEKELMYWITRIAFMEQYTYPLATEALIGKYCELFIRSNRIFLKALADHGYIKNRRNINLYVQLLMRIVRSYQLDFTHPPVPWIQQDNQEELCAHIIKMILCSEGTQDQYRKLVRGDG